MAEIKTAKNAVEIRSELKENGTTIEYIVIDGVTCGILGSANEADKAAALKALQSAYVASNGNIIEMMQNLSIIANIEEKGIEPDEVVDVNGIDIILSYSKAKAYTMDGKEIANCDDLPDISKDAVKAVLVARAELALN